METIRDVKKTIERLKEEREERLSIPTIIINMTIGEDHTNVHTFYFPPWRKPDE